MPQYLFENQETGETREVWFGMNDTKVYNGEDGTEAGKWKRVFIAPLAAVDVNIDPFDGAAFANSSRYKTVGDVWDKSAELSEKRAAIMGTDPIKQKKLDEYAAKRRGKRHPEELKQAQKKATDEAKAAMKKLGISFK